MTEQPDASPGKWVLLTYRLPRDPSTPRITVWRKLRRLGVAQLSDGLVALPAEARTREQLEWIAGEVREAAGSAGVWLARPVTLAQERELAAAMAAARVQEYEAVREQADAARSLPPGQGGRVVARLRGELRAIRRRDFFPPSEREAAIAAVEELAAASVQAAPPETRIPTGGRT